MRGPNNAGSSSFHPRTEPADIYDLPHARLVADGHRGGCPREVVRGLQRLRQSATAAVGPHADVLAVHGAVRRAVLSGVRARADRDWRAARETAGSLHQAPA